MSRSVILNLKIVLHRIDDLEIQNTFEDLVEAVLHRIDDLEIKPLLLDVPVFVLHRIDDLEKSDPSF